MHGKFTGFLILHPEDSNYWKVLSPLQYRTKDGIKITIPKNFLTDFASVPRILWNILPPWGAYGKAAIMHDYFYYSGMFSKGMSDLIFLEAMETLKVKRWKRYAMYFSVKYFGFVAWLKHRKNNDVARG